MATVCISAQISCFSQTTLTIKRLCDLCVFSSFKFPYCGTNTCMFCFILWPFLTNASAAMWGSSEAERVDVRLDLLQIFRRARMRISIRSQTDFLMCFAMQTSAQQREPEFIIYGNDWGSGSYRSGGVWPDQSAAERRGFSERRTGSPLLSWTCRTSWNISGGKAKQNRKERKVTDTDTCIHMSVYEWVWDVQGCWDQAWCRRAWRPVGTYPAHKSQYRTVGEGKIDRERLRCQTSRMKISLIRRYKRILWSAAWL